ncbi:MAG TPA: RidA family protein [Sphingomicrobium sp.]|nr:RidA family protein [Sphingomicrobium sp.]
MRAGIIFLLGSLVIHSSALAQSPVRMTPPKAPIATSVGVPAGSDIVFVSGTVPDSLEGSPASFGDTETQTRSILSKIEAELARHGMGLGDVVMMRVFLVAPKGQDRMDFAGMMKAYSERFGTAEQPNKPARSTMQVAGLVHPDWLVEIEVTAARPAHSTPAGSPQ